MRRLMYIERKAGALQGEARIGWVELSRSKRTYSYRGRQLKKVGSGYKYNCIDIETGDTYWVSGPKRRGGDSLYGMLVEIDDDAREEYWVNVRASPEFIDLSQVKS